MKALLSILMFSLLLSCGKERKSSGKRIVPIPQEEVAFILENQVFDCATIQDGPCPEGIARLFIINPVQGEESAVCTGFMVGRRTLVTNNHCVPTQNECVNTFVAVYQGREDRYLSSRCRQVIHTEVDFADPRDLRKSIDVSVLELEDDYSGEVFRVSSSRASPREQLSAWVLDHTGVDREESNLLESRITEFSCRVKESESASLVLEDCPVVQGNSGSPVVNERGEVAAVIWGGTATFDSSLELKERRRRNQEASATEAINFERYLP